MTLTRRKDSDKGKSLNLEEIAALVHGELVGDPTATITGVAGIKEARPGQITFLANPKYLSFLDETQATAVITPQDVASSKKALIRTANPSEAFTKVASFFIPESSVVRAPGVHGSAVVDPSTRLGERVHIGPHAVIEADCVIGSGSVLDGQVFIGKASRIGSDCRVYPNVTVREGTEIGDRVIIHSGTVIGSDGFGYETSKGMHMKIPQLGSVCIEDDVEIGANVCIDRGRFQKTLVGKGTKIDNLVQIAHNVVIGPHSIIISQAGISGSTEIGRNVIIAGQAGLVGHIRIGDESVIGAGAGVTKSLPNKSVVLGSPAKPVSEQKKLFALIARLPELFKEITQIKEKLGMKP